MNILSLQLGRVSSACLVQSGVVVAAVSQERFDNSKGSTAFPYDAIQWLLADAHIRGEDIDVIAVSGEDIHVEAFLPLVSVDKIRYYDHHLCHAYAPLAFFGPTDEEWLVFVADGRAALVYKWDGLLMEPLSESSGCLGQFYAASTEKLGMRSYAHEGKVMGLAAYAKREDFESVYNELYRDLIKEDEDNPLALREQDVDLFAHYARFDHEAGAVQQALETVVTNWVRVAVKETGISRIMTSGGVFTNVRLNKLIREMPEVSEARFMPSAGNETNVFGAAYAAYPDLKPMKHLYWGQHYSDDEIKAFLKKEGKEFKYRRHNDVEKEIATLIADHKVVARFSGRAEFGARSLGNRAILAHPADRDSFYKINDHIKARDFWMPFAPTVLDCDAARYLKDVCVAPYMIDSFDTTVAGAKNLCAAMHQADKTVRPQILREADNPDYYRLISFFKEKTGIGAVMNTSFNLHGYPLAASLEQALLTMRNSDLQYVALGSWLVERQ